MNSVNFIQEKINTAKTLDFGTIFNDAIQLFKKVWVQGLLLYLFILLITIPIVALFYGPMYIEMFEQIQSGNADPQAMNDYIYGRSPLFMLGYYAVMFIVGAITSLLYAGFYRVVKKIDFGEAYKTSDLFYYLSGKYFLKGFLLMIITSAMSFVAAMLCVFPIFYVIVPIAFIMVIFAFNPDFSIGDIISLGFSLGNKKWGITFALGLVSYLCVIVLILITCGVGMLFFNSFIFLPIYIIYKVVIGFGDQDEINKIGQIQED